MAWTRITSSAGLLPAVLTLCSVITGEPAAAQDFAGKFGAALNQDGEFIDPEGIAVAGAGTIYVTDTGRQMVFAFDSQGTLIDSQASTSLAVGGLQLPGDVAVGPNGNVYVVDRGQAQVYIYDSNLNPLSAFGSLCVAPEIPGENCIDPDGDGPLEVGDGQFQSPNSIAWDPNSNRLLATDDANDRVQIFDADGNFLDKFGSEGSGDGQFQSPSGIAATPDGNIVVADAGNDRVQVFDGSGNFLLAFGSEGDGDGEFDGPTSVEVDAGGRIYVLDRFNNRAQIFDPQGGHIASFGSRCPLLLGEDCVDPDDDGPLETGDGQFHGPAGLAMDSLGQIFVVDTLNQRVEFFIMDRDGDALPDLWETAGIDINGDGEIDFDLPAHGADPDRKDIFVEIDYMAFHEPRADAMDDVIQAFAEAPVENPEGPDGIDLHLEVGEEIPHQDSLALWDDFDDLKPNWFGTEQERADFANVLAAKRLAYRYAMFIHDRTPTPGSSGRAEIGGNDFLVSLGGSNWPTDAMGHNVGSRTDQSSTLMHELGHTLGLLHGGSEGINCKPNYLSVMNYQFQPALIPDPTAPTDRLDYSREALTDLQEMALDESVGIEDGDLQTRYTADNGATTLLGDGSGPINWDNEDPFPADGTVPVDINNFLIRDCGLDDMGNDTSDPDETLVGVNDWKILDYNFRDDEEFDDGVHQEAPIEITPEIKRILSRCPANSEEPRCLQRRYEYAAKFVCGIQTETKTDRLGRGGYATTINVHNPLDEAVRIFSKLALTFPPAEMLPGEVLRVGRNSLGYDQAFAIDCADVRERLYPDGWPSGYIEGFLIVQSASSLDVRGVYTIAGLAANDQPSGPNTIDIEDISERIVKRRPDARDRADLIVRDIDLTSLRSDCDGPGNCVTRVRVTVANIGSAAAGPSTLRTTLDPSGSVVVQSAVPGLAPGASIAVLVTTPPGGNCFDPNCKICGFADSKEEVEESDEDNNELCREARG